MPYTTKGAYANAVNGLPVKIYPYRAAGKLFLFLNGGGTATCSASVIERGVVVTAAHCIWNFGVGLSITGATFVPAYHNGQAPWGQWTASGFVLPVSYQNGSDVCSSNSPGVVCENDLALLVMNTGSAPYAGLHVGQVVGKFSYFINNQGYTNFIIAPSLKAGHITALGYPGALDSGERMQRTDSLGFQDNINQLLIGTDQTQGSSGGPWLMNFGRQAAVTPTPIEPGFAIGAFSQQNKLVGVTSNGPKRYAQDCRCVTLWSQHSISTRRADQYTKSSQHRLWFSCRPLLGSHIRKSFPA